MSGLYSLSQPPSAPVRSRVDPEAQAQITSLRMLAARADHLRDRIGELAMIINQDPVGDRHRQTMLPWSTLLEWYQSIFQQAQEFSNFLQNPVLLSAAPSSASRIPNSNMLSTTFVQPAREISSCPETSGLIYHQPDPPIRPHPQINYYEARKSMYDFYRTELEAMSRDPESLGFMMDEDLGRLLVEDRTARLPRIYRNVEEEVVKIKTRMNKAKQITQELGQGFDWKMRLGNIYGTESDDDNDEEDEDDEDEDEDMVEVTGSTEQPQPARSSTNGTSPATSTVQPISATSLPAHQTGAQDAPIELELSDDEDLAPTTAATGSFDSPAHSSPLFGSDDGTAQGTPAPVVTNSVNDDDDDDEDMEEVQA